MILFRARGEEIRVVMHFGGKLTTYLVKNSTRSVQISFSNEFIISAGIGGQDGDVFNLPCNSKIVPGEDRPEDL